MICDSCKLGGEHNADAQRLLSIPQPAGSLGLVSVAGHSARISHGYCTGGCDCQHKVGKWLSRATDRPMELSTS